MDIDETNVMKRLKDSVPLIQGINLNEEHKKIWNNQLELSKLKIWIDPLDGTKEYTLGYVQYVTSLLGIAVDNNSQYGVIHKPFGGHDKEKQETYLGGKGLGVMKYEDSKVINLPPFTDKGVDDVTLLVTRSHYNESTERMIKAVKPSKALKVGGAGNKILEVIVGEGNCYIYPSKGLKLWDVCAGEALIKSLNGYISDSLGKPIAYGGDHYVKGLIMARNEDLFNKLLKDLQGIPELKSLF